MTILPDNPIPQLVSLYRKLKAQRDAIDRQLSQVKEQLEPAIEANGGKWADDRGYAKMVTRRDSVSYPSVDVNRLAVTWSGSVDPIMQSCGNMLLDLRKKKAGYSYLQVK